MTRPWPVPVLLLLAITPKLIVSLSRADVIPHESVGGGGNQDHSGDAVQQLLLTARQLVAPGKGLLAADESTNTMAKRLQQVGVSNTDANRAAWRQLLLTTAGLQQHISGVILTEETLYQQLQSGPEDQCVSDSSSDDDSPTTCSSSSGGSSSSSTVPASRRLVDLLLNQGIAVGVKVDKGLAPLHPDPATEPFEVQTMGLEGLQQRCKQYAADGATFAKWRAVLKVNPALGWPSQAAVDVNAAQLAQFAAAAQAAGLVPVVEPEVMVMEGDHGLEVAEAVSTRVLASVVKTILDHNVTLEGVILKPAMVLPGSSSGGCSGSNGSSGGSNGSPCSSTAAANVADVAAATVRVLRRTVPPAVPGIAFLSGGQDEQQAARHLAAINAECSSVETAARTPPEAPDHVERSGASASVPRCHCPWALTFSFGRALQASALKLWAGAPQDVAAAQQVFSRVAATAAAAAAAVTGAVTSTQAPV